MFYHPDTQTYVREGAAFTLDGVQFPANFLNLSTPEEKIAHGLVEVITVGERADERTHFVSEELVGAERRIINTPKPPEMLAALDAADRAAELTRVRALREQVLDRLAGIAGRASRKGDTTLASACDSASEALLDITTDLPADSNGTKLAIALRYMALRDAAITEAPTLETAFAKVDA
jgi:hypothetical protein